MGKGLVSVGLFTVGGIAGAVGARDVFVKGFADGWVFIIAGLAMLAFSLYLMASKPKPPTQWPEPSPEQLRQMGYQVPPQRQDYPYRP
ncbi:hypothetical protein ACFU44_00275 [Nocardia rhizosphaerihabitans]|uniref:hypothetical protein n=1 Tax=Nocardia rhizosphaerihabitans TaxID=1691570 RepID=UPI00366FE656